MVDEIFTSSCPNAGCHDHRSHSLHREVDLQHVYNPNYMTVKTQTSKPPLVIYFLFFLQCAEQAIFSVFIESDRIELMAQVHNIFDLPLSPQVRWDLMTRNFFASSR
jgi:predicted DNA-binding helix-hairpin-helix protein